eukprot:5760621-Alexandrium_andersonii.AAC.1
MPAGRTPACARSPTSERLQRLLSESDGMLPASATVVPTHSRGQRARAASLGASSSGGIKGL